MKNVYTMAKKKMFAYPFELTILLINKNRARGSNHGENSEYEVCHSTHSIPQAGVELYNENPVGFFNLTLLLDSRLFTLSSIINNSLRLT